MHLLILGGTAFLGRHIVDAACAAGDTVTLLNRGRREPALYPQLERLVGDRDGDLSALAGRHFDAVIDCCGYTPAQLRRSADALAGAVPHYVFVSSISALAGFPPGQRFDETAPVAAGDEGYGPLKARAEEAVEAIFPGHVAIVRPGLIAGPFDPTGRFSYWPRRLARGGRVLAPGRPERPVQLIDARDLAAFCLALARAQTSGLFHAVGPMLPMAQLLADCQRAEGPPVELAWRDDDTLLAHGVTPWTGLPLWLPEHDPAFGGMLLGDDTRAVQAGLHCRSVRETAADTLAWIEGGGVEAAPVASLTPEDEARCLA